MAGTVYSTITCFSFLSVLQVLFIVLQICKALLLINLLCTYKSCFPSPVFFFVFLLFLCFFFVCVGCLFLGGRSFTPTGASVAPTDPPPTVVAPSSGMSDGLARMTFATSSRATSGFNMKTKVDNAKCAKIEAGDQLDSRTRNEPSDRLDNNSSLLDAANGEVTVTPKKSQSNGDEWSLPPPTPKSSSKYGNI